MALLKPASIVVHQCLFGYRDGHRLLASSVKLPGESTTPLLVLSDLAPGLASLGVGGYWTGVPLAATKFYALMRTWPAPEMPRPGCVWTQVLLIAYADMTRFADLGVLMQEFKRPETLDEIELYTEPLAFDSTILQAGDRLQAIDPHGACRILRAIYTPDCSNIISASNGALDEEIFAVWSQQWPRLRRSFSFRTAVSSSDVMGVGIRFDLCVTQEQEPFDLRSRSEVLMTRWEIAATEDLGHAQPSDFRRFLWRYGSDVRRGREKFSFLVEVYLSTLRPSFSGNQFVSTLKDVLTNLPNPEDGRLLKEDFVSARGSQYSLLPPIDPLVALDFFVSCPEVECLPEPGIEIVTAVEELWATRPDEVLSIAAIAAERRTEFNDALLEHFAQHIDAGFSIKLASMRPALWELLLRANPQILESEEIYRVPESELVRFVPLISEDDLGAVENFVGHIIKLDDFRLASDFAYRFPEITIKTIVKEIERRGEGFDSLVASAWIQVLSERKIELLQGGFLESAHSTNTLAVLADILGHDTLEVLEVGPLPWATGIYKAQDDVKGHARQVFLSFILAIALAGPCKGCELILERAFETIHRDISKSTLPSDAYSILSRHLPDVAWRWQWDTCLRLRLAVVRAYINSDLDPQSFRRLTSDALVFKQLLGLASETKRGQNLIKQIS